MKNNLFHTTVALYTATFALGLFIAFSSATRSSADVVVKAPSQTAAATPLVSALR